jgi:hypothetical protein
VSQSIDGSILELIEDHELEEELGITQKIVKKKILNCNVFIGVLI